MKHLLFWVILFLPLSILNAQPPCASNPAAGNSCATATPICDLNGYCGSTASSYTANTWGSSGAPIGCGFLGLQACPGTGLTGAFCGSIENNSFLSFTASATSISFDVWVTSSTLGYGIQIFIFSVANCGTGNVTQYGPCYNPGVVQPGPVNITASGLTIGNTYYIMIDGNAGDVCNYVIGANSGIATPVYISPDVTNVCPGQTVNLTAGGGDGNYSWTPSPDLNTTTGANVTVTPPLTPGTYTYTVNSNIGTPQCPNSGSFDATIIVDNCGCNITAGNGGDLCAAPGLTTNLTCSGIPGASYSWTGPAGFTSTAQNPTNVAVPSTPGSYVYTVEANDNGTICSATTTIVVNALPNANAGSDALLTCTTTSVNLSGASTTSGVTFAWSGPGITANSNTNTPTVNQPGTYTVIVTNPSTGCQNSDQAQVTQNTTPPDVNAGTALSISCLLPTLTLSGSSTTPNVSCLWTGPGILSGGSTFSPVVNASGTYTLTVTNNLTGCTSSSTVNVGDLTSSPNANAGLDMVLTCANTTAVLNGSSSTAGATFSWSGPGIVSGGSTNNPTVNQVGNYTLTVTNPSNGCTSTDQVNITQNTTSPVANAGADQTLNCSTNSLVLNGSASAAGMNYSWSGPGIVSGGNTTSPTISQAGTYTITVTNPANGCSSTDNVVVNSDINLPPVDFTADTLTGCEQLTVNFTGIATAGLQYAWDFGDGGNAASLNTVHTFNGVGCYDVSLTVTNSANGCSNTHQITDYICIVPNPTASFVVTPDDGCSPLTITMANNSQNASVYDWTLTPGGTQQTVNLNPVTITVTESAQIELTAWNSLGCQNSTLAFVTMLNCGCTDPLALNYDPSVAVEDGSCVYPPPSITVPNVFTPNGDGTNDFFEFSPSFIAEIQVTIVNRWGNLVFEGSGPDPKWDGKINSNEASDGTYFYNYRATTLLGEELEGHGFVQLLRSK